MQPKQDTLIPRKKANFGSHEDEKLTLEEQDIEKDYRNLGGKSLDIESHAKDGLAGRTPQAGLFGSESSSSLREVRFSDEEFAADILIFNIKYNHPRFQNDNTFFPFYNQLNY